MTDLEDLRPFVTAGKTDLAWRRQQLETLRQALIDEKDTCLKAIHQDLGTDSTQASLMQVASLFAEVDVCLENMDKWSSPEYVSTPLALQPATSYIQAQPKGVVLVLGAWNYPLSLNFGPACCAIAAGNCVVIKPSELTPECAKVVQLICKRLDPSGVRCVLGGPEVAAALTKQTFDHIFYTGGPRVAKLVLAAAAPNLTPVTCELGGKSPVIVAKGINIGEACTRIATHKFSNTGQTCIAPDYVLVEDSISQQFASTLVNTVKAMFGDQPESSEYIGRLVNSVAAERLFGYLGEDHGGKVLLGGEKPCGDVREGHRYVPPTIVFEPKKESKLLQEEIFGPILSIVPVTSCADAISYVNSKPKPLALYVFAPSSTAKTIIDHTSSGGAIVGDAIIHKGNANLPFGGVGNSGMGKTHGIHGFKELSNMRAVMYRPLFAPSLLTLPVKKPLAVVAWLYTTSRPGKYLRDRMWKIIAVLLVFLFARNRLRR